MPLLIANFPIPNDSFRLLLQPVKTSFDDRPNLGFARKPCHACRPSAVASASYDQHTADTVDDKSDDGPNTGLTRGWSRTFAHIQSRHADIHCYKYEGLCTCCSWNRGYPWGRPIFLTISIAWYTCKHCHSQMLRLQHPKNSVLRKHHVDSQVIVQEIFLTFIFASHSFSPILQTLLLVSWA